MCVILYTEINGKKILAKNRDRAYKPNIKIIHEIVNGIEVAYLKDENTGWIEGMNSNGVGIVNSTLSSKDSKQHIRKQVLSEKKNVIYKLLVDNDKRKNFYDIIKHAKSDYVLEGHTLLFHDSNAFHVENTLANKFIIEKIDKTSVFSNHGIRIKNAGYRKCIKGLSTFLRSDIVKQELKNNNIKSEEDLIDIMNRNYKNIDSRFHPYRDKYYTMKKHKNLERKKVKISTTGQILLNMTDKEFTYYADVNNSKKIEYINKLPRDYMPQIRIIIKETEKRIKSPKNIFTKKYLKKVYENFDCKKTKRHKLGRDTKFKNTRKKFIRTSK